MQDSKETLSWSALFSIFIESDVTPEVLSNLVQGGRLSSLAKSLSSQSTNEEIATAKEVFNGLISRLLLWHSNAEVSSTKFCSLVESLVMGNLTLLEPSLYPRLIDSVLNIDLPTAGSEVRQRLASSLATLLYLHPVDYKSGYGAIATTGTTLAAPAGRSNPDFLDRARGECCLHTLVRLLEEAKDAKAELSCFHALVQLICHRKLFRLTQPSSPELQDIVHALCVVWPFVFCTPCRSQQWGEAEAPPASSGSSFPSSSSSSCGETSDGGSSSSSADNEAPCAASNARGAKKSRLLATFCLRRLLTSRWICQEVWTLDGKRSFQQDLLGALCREHDARLRELFIVMLGGILNNLKQRFSIAEELSNWQPASFIPYSVRLAGELRLLHRSLNWALLTERSLRHQLALLKVLATLVTITPYHRLRCGLISSLATVLHAFHARAHKDHARRALCFAHILAVWTAILATPPTPEIHQLLTTTPAGSAMLPLSAGASPPSTACWLVELCVRLVGEGEGAGEATEETPQPGVLRLQAVATLKAFVALHYDCLVPSMPEIEGMIKFGLQSGREENRTLRPLLLRLCDTLLSHTFKCLEEKVPSCLPLDHNWWFDIIATLIDIASASVDHADCWWICQVVGVFFELLALLQPAFPLPSALSTTCAALCARGVGLFASLCRSSTVETRSKALRKLCTLAILESPFIPSDLLSLAMEVTLQMLPSATPRVACETAYCLELCTLKAMTLRRIPEGWSIPRILQAALRLSAFPLPDTQATGWTGQDGSRCEHALQSLANLVDLASTSREFRSFDFSPVVHVFCTRLRTANISGAEKVRWNAALGAGRLLANLPEEDTVVRALCEAFTTDPYFKVRTYAGLSLLLHLLRGPTHPQTEAILVCSIHFLCMEPKQFSTTTATVDAAHYLVLCAYIAARLLLQAGILALQAVRRDWAGAEAGLERIVEALEGECNMCENLTSSLYYAKEAKIAALAVMKPARGGVTGGGLARAPNQPMVISFAERYSLLHSLSFDEPMEELWAALEAFEAETRRGAEAALLSARVAKGLTRLAGLITDGATLMCLRRTQLRSTAPSEGRFRTTYD